MTQEELDAIRSLDRARIKTLEVENAELQQQLAIQIRVNNERGATVAKLARDVMALKSAASEFPQQAQAKLEEVASAGRTALKRSEILAGVLRNLVADGTLVQRIPDAQLREVQWHIATRDANELLDVIDRSKAG